MEIYFEREHGLALNKELEVEAGDPGNWIRSTRKITCKRKNLNSSPSKTNNVPPIRYGMTNSQPLCGDCFLGQPKNS
jgi:hypothetical protein